MSEVTKHDTSGQDIASGDWIKSLEEFFIDQPATKKRQQIPKNIVLKVEGLDRYGNPLVTIRGEQWTVEHPEKTKRLMRKASHLDIDNFHHQWAEIEFEVDGEILTAKGFVECAKGEFLKLLDYDPREAMGQRTESSVHTIAIQLVKDIKRQPAGPVEYSDPLKH